MKWKTIFVLLSIGGALSPVAVLVYSALGGNQAAIMIIAVLGALALIVVGSAMTLAVQHVHSSLQNTHMQVNMVENMQLLAATAKTQGHILNTQNKMQDVTPKEETVPPALVVSNEAFAELDLPQH